MEERTVSPNYEKMMYQQREEIMKELERTHEEYQLKMTLLEKENKFLKDIIKRTLHISE
jgi:hypothetical protein